jgi:hypothetical protein
VLASLSVTFAMMTVSPMTEGNAATAHGREWLDPGHGNDNVTNHNGNGSFNRNNFSVNSPSFARGNQHIFNQIMGGKNPIQASLCQRRFHHCRIRQRMVIEDP